MAGHRVQLDSRWSLWQDVAVRRAGLPIELVEQFALPRLLTETGGEDAAVKAASAAAMWNALSDDLFVSAVTWQNPAVMETWAAGLAGLARRGLRREITRVNERERLIARYAQRYSAKCESIGFFGPVAWARFTDAGVDLSVRGALGIRRRSVAFETWALSAVAEAWAKDPRLLPHLPVRLDPATSVDGRLLRHPRRASVELDDLDLAIVTEATGRRRICELVAAATRRSGISEEKIAFRVAELCASHTLQAGFTIPFSDRPEEHLRRQLKEVPDVGLRDELLGILDDLERDRDALVATATDPESLLTAMEQVQAGFEKAGGSAARTLPRGGRGRTAVYIDCRCDLDIEIGRPLLNLLRAPLGIILDSGRWLCAEVGHVVEAELRRQYRRLQRSREVVTLAELQLAAAAVLVPGNQIVDAVLEDFQLRWAEVLPQSEDRLVRLSADRIEPIIRALFPDRRPGWATARQHSPDLLLCKNADGSLGWVLGELHLSMNTLESRVFVTQADERQRLIDATAADFPGGRVVPLYPLAAVASNSRTYPPPALDPPGLYRYWSFGSDQGHEHGVESVPATAVRVAERDGELIAHAADRQERVVEFFGEFLTAVCVNLFKPRPPRPHAPRVSIDDLVICRETWRIPAESIPLPRSRPQDYTYGGLRGWAATTGLPRHVFVQSPLQVKPIYIDFSAPALVDNLARLVRAAAQEPGGYVQISEMLPNPDQLWLTDATGRRYATEFRMVAVDDIGG